MKKEGWGWQVYNLDIIKKKPKKPGFYKKKNRFKPKKQTGLFFFKKNPGFLPSLQVANVTLLPISLSLNDFTLSPPLTMEEHIDQYRKTILAA